MVTLSAVEAQVLGALMEKDITTPEYYPLSLQAQARVPGRRRSGSGYMRSFRPRRMRKRFIG